MLPGILRISADENFRQRAIFSALLSAEILSDKESLFISPERQFDDGIGLTDGDEDSDDVGGSQRSLTVAR